jgi:hypothetical protein
LSIAASVTSFLTFIGAIMAFIFVRYNTLRNAHNEMSTILESVSTAIVETRTMTQTLAQQGGGPESAPLEKLVTDLFSIEFSILSEYVGIYRGIVGTLLPRSLSIPPLQAILDELLQIAQQTDRVQSTEHTSNMTVVSETTHRFGNSVLDWSNLIPNGYYNSLVLGSLRFVFTFGNTSTLLRWYIIRDKVLEKHHQREILRPRLLFYQLLYLNK